MRVHHGFLSLGLLLAALSELAAPPSDLQQYKAIVRGLFQEALSQGRLDVFLEIHDKDSVAHAGTRAATLAEDLESAKKRRQAFPDAACAVDQYVAEGDLVTLK